MLSWLITILYNQIHLCEKRSFCEKRLIVFVCPPRTIILVVILQIIKSFLYLHRNIIAYSSDLPFLFYIRPQIHSYFIFVRISTLVLYSSRYFLILFWSNFFIPQIIKKMMILSGQYNSNIIVQILLFIKFWFSLVLHLILNMDSCQGEGFHCIVTFYLTFEV